jgi:hypothetical protein
MSEHSAQIYTVCQCIDHCFSFVMWCDDFAPYVDPEDMMGGLDRASDIMSDATRLQSFLALRKLDDFLGGVTPKAGDLTAKTLGVDAATLLKGVGGKFLTKEERDSVNKGVAHLTEQLTLDPDSEIELCHAHAAQARAVTADGRASQDRCSQGSDAMARSN